RKINSIPHLLEPFPLRPGEEFTIGSGFIINEGRQVVTNRHVVEKGNTFYVRNGIGELRKARVLRTGTVDDLAILTFEEPFSPTSALALDASGGVRTGQKAIVIGFPLANIVGEQAPSITNGIVSKDTGLGDDPKTFQLTAKLNKGNSGGPVLGEDGRLIGIAVGKLDSMKIASEQGHLPEDINIAIKAERLLSFLGHQVGDGAAVVEIHDLESLYEMMLPRVVMVVSLDRR
ncbi:MAG: serine protease, partial [Opitutales bacterium]